MKKIISIFLIAYILLWSINFSFATLNLPPSNSFPVDESNAPVNPNAGETPPETVDYWISEELQEAPINNWQDTTNIAWWTEITDLNKWSTTTLQDTLNEFPSTSPTTDTTLPKDATVNWITIWQECLLNWQCKFNVYDALGIRQSIRNPWDQTSVWLFVQDIVLSATMFIGTVITISIIVSWLMWIFAWASGKDPSKAKSWLVNSIIWLLLVISSYMIIRLVQYIAKWF